MKMKTYFASVINSSGVYEDFASNVFFNNVSRRHVRHCVAKRHILNVLHRTGCLLKTIRDRYHFHSNLWSCCSCLGWRSIYRFWTWWEKTDTCFIKRKEQLYECKYPRWFPVSCLWFSPWIFIMQWWGLEFNTWLLGTGKHMLQQPTSFVLLMTSLLYYIIGKCVGTSWWG